MTMMLMVTMTMMTRMMMVKGMRDDRGGMRDGE